MSLTYKNLTEEKKNIPKCVDNQQELVEVMG